MRRDQHSGHLEPVGHRAAVERACPTERDQREVARIEAALHRDEADRVRHVLVCDPDGRQRRGFGREAQRVAEPGEGVARGGRVDLHPAAEEVVRVEPAEHEIRVGRRRLGSALAVCDRARLGAGAPRPHVQEAALVEPADRASAGADRRHRDAGDADRGSPTRPGTRSRIAALRRARARCRSSSRPCRGRRPTRTPRARRSTGPRRRRRRGPRAGAAPAARARVPAGR